MTNEFIPYNLPAIGDEEIAEVTDTLRSGWLTTGPKTHLFQEEFCQYVGAPHALAVNSCTAALHLALLACGIGPGDEVITTPLTFCATVNSILHVGATPVLADIDENGNISPAAIERKITPRTRAILPVHFAGYPCDMDAIWALADKHGIKVIEDAAHAIGTHHGNTSIGGVDAVSGRKSAAVAYSFYATKNLTTGEGGMVTTHDPGVFERMTVLCLHGINKDAWNRYSANGKWKYEVVECGYKYNLSDVQSAIGIHQLRKQERFLARRQEIVSDYNAGFAGMEEVITPTTPARGRHSWHLYVLRLQNTGSCIRRDEMIESLRTAGVGTSVHFIPIPMHPVYQAIGLTAPCPAALAFYETCISLPLYPTLTTAQVRRVIQAVKQTFVDGRQRSTSTARYAGMSA